MKENRYLFNYLRLKKKTKEINLNNYPFINGSLKIHSDYFEDCTVIPLCSTDIYPETITHAKIQYVLFDINYSRYVEQLYNNIKFVSVLSSNNDKDTINIIINNIKSDAYHFLALKQYASVSLSLAFTKKSKKLFKQPSLQREADFGDMIFFEASNLYIVRHENAHNYFQRDSSLNDKQQFYNEISKILVLLKDGKINANQELHQLGENHSIDISNEYAIVAIQDMLSNSETDALFEELFCDYISFIEVMTLYRDTAIARNNDSLEVCLKVHEALSIFDYISDFYRRIGESISINASGVRATMRHSINNLIKAQVSIEILSSGKPPLPPSSLLAYFAKNRFMALDSTQDIFFEHLLKIILEVRAFKVTKESDLEHVEPSISEEINRNKMLVW